MHVSVARVALLLLGSGFCALAYQQVWLRLLRLTFGSSTAASACVLAIFLGGLGLGGMYFGPRADRSDRPLRLYGILELGVAASAALSPALLSIVRSLYVYVGGTVVLGEFVGIAARLILAILVLGVPTFLMGGTLPAAVRAVETPDDAGRRNLGVLYGLNTMGAVLGTAWATFAAIERIGLEGTLLAAAAVNGAIGFVAIWLANRAPAVAVDPPREVVPEPGQSPVWLVLAGSAVVGFAFLLMELVWYRMLGPILGGSSYTFGLILVVALAGIGVGGWVYGQRPATRRPTLYSFAITCALEAVLVLVPLALGDRLALLAAQLRPLGALGFPSLVGGWAVIASIVVFPASAVAGYQFPLLVALLGKGSASVGRQVGLAYALNTAGAIIGSVAGGFWLIPAISSPGVWRLVVVLLAALAALCTVVAWRDRAVFRSPAQLFGVLSLFVAIAVLSGAEGPTAFWRHGGIGVGRMNTAFAGVNDWRARLSDRARGIAWEVDGVESTVAMNKTDGFNFIINGKSDGHAITDAQTQVISGLLGVLLHPEPRRVLVIGLGTGSTAGWLAAVPSVERVDVIELEPQIEHIASDCALVNQDVLRNPKVVIHYGDGREFLLTTPERYDVIFSEPSNPYRAGIASLFTQEFYRAVSGRLAPGGLFMQWTQAYAVDADTIHTVYATLGSVFGQVETWELKHDMDLVMLASAEPIVHDLQRSRERLASEPFKTAFERVLGVQGVEGLYGGYLAPPAFGRAVADTFPDLINTDDRPVIEFRFARNVGHSGLFSVSALRAAVRASGGTLPVPLSADLVADARSVRVLAAEAKSPEPVSDAGPTVAAHVQARRAYFADQMDDTVREWSLAADGGAPATQPMDQVMLGEAYAHQGSDTALVYADALYATQPATADALRARYYHSKGDILEASRALYAAFLGMRTDPWVYRPLLVRSLDLASRLVAADPRVRVPLYEGLSQPFAVANMDDLRIHTLFRLADGEPARCVRALAELEPYPFWDEAFLRARADCYAAANDGRVVQAEYDISSFMAAKPRRFGEPFGVR